MRRLKGRMEKTETKTLQLQRSSTDAHYDSGLASTSCIAIEDPSRLNKDSPQAHPLLSLPGTGRRGLPSEARGASGALSWASNGRSRGG